MAITVFVCGCSITRSMYGERDVMYVHHCREHYHLFSQNKTLLQMSEEIIKIQLLWDM